MKISIPYKPYHHFTPFHAREQRWAWLCCHRRAGKTVASINDLIRGALTCDKPDPRFAFIAPTYSQAKDVAWGYLKHYTRDIPAIEHRESELSANFPNGGRVRLYGAENYDRLRGLYLDGCVLDEAGLIDPRAWPEVIRPSLSDRSGWGVFMGTPNGRNQFFDIGERARGDKDWYRVELKASETKLIPRKELEDAQKQLTEEQYLREYECSFDAAIMGAYYGSELRIATNEGRIGRVSYDPSVPVWVSWDLGMSDRTALWLAQCVGTEIHVIDYYENSGEALDHYVKWLKSRRYNYSYDILPHDAKARELGTGKSREETLETLGRETIVLPNQKVMDGINAVRMTLPRCWFDEKKCDIGLQALREYRAKENDGNPLHDWASHGADSFRYLIQGIDREEKTEPVRERPHSVLGWMFS